MASPTRIWSCAGGGTDDHAGIDFDLHAWVKTYGGINNEEQRHIILVSRHEKVSDGIRDSLIHRFCLILRGN